MPQIRFENEAVEVDAAVIAKGLGLEANVIQAQMRSGTITSLCERGEGVDAGTFRLSFFTEHKRLRLIVSAAGEIIRRTTLASPDRPLPAAMRKPGG